MTDRVTGPRAGDDLTFSSSSVLVGRKRFDEARVVAKTVRNSTFARRIALVQCARSVRSAGGRDGTGQGPAARRRRHLSAHRHRRFDAPVDTDPEAMAVALATHERVIAEIVDGAGGWLLRERGEGDSTLSVFAPRDRRGHRGARCATPTAWRRLGLISSCSRRASQSTPANPTCAMASTTAEH